MGYESEPAFNRAFKREFGLPPARYRREHKDSLNILNPRAVIERPQKRLLLIGALALFTFASVNRSCPLPHFAESPCVD